MWNKVIPQACLTIGRVTSIAVAPADEIAGARVTPTNDVHKHNRKDFSEQIIHQRNTA